MILKQNNEDGKLQPNQVSSDITKNNNSSYGGYLLTGFGLIVALVAGFAAWSFFAPLQGAVIAPGTVVVEGKPKTLQHLDGCLLYTSPSPRDRTRSRMPSSA